LRRGEDDLAVVQDHQALGDEFVQLWQEGADAFFAVDDDDGDRQVLAQRQQAGGVDE
jgi:hypothetical protein